MAAKEKPKKEEKQEIEKKTTKKKHEKKTPKKKEETKKTKKDTPKEKKTETPKEVKEEPKKEEAPKKEEVKEEPKKDTQKGKIFDTWELNEVKITDPGLKGYINLESFLVLHTHGKHSSKQFEKENVSIVERLINCIMRSGTKKRVGGHRITTRKGCGKKAKAYKTVEEAFQIINNRTKENPIQVLVKAVENSAPREETTRVKYGGITKHIAVDISPQRRVDFALRNLSVAALARAYKNKKSRAEALAEELISAAKEESTSMAINKKNEAERVARGAR